MKIFDIDGFPNPLRVRIALAEKNATNSVEFIPVDVLAGEHRTDKFKQMNPNMGVPILALDDGTYISESSAIIDYIDLAFEGPSLTGRSAKEKALISMFQRQAEFMVLDAIGAYFHHATNGLGPELKRHQNKEWGIHQRNTALAGLEYFDDVLSNRAYITGKVFTAADITLYSGLVFAGFANIEIPQELTNLTRWQSLVSSRASIKEA